MIMQCVTCNKSSLFAPRPKKDKFTLIVHEAQDTNSFLYEIKRQKNIEITKDIVPFHHQIQRLESILVGQSE
jgi:hypothetical protein